MLTLALQLSRCVLVGLVCLCAIWAGAEQTAAQSAPPVLIDDLNQATTGTRPHLLTQVGEHFYYVADSVGRGAELWRFDERTGATVLVSGVRNETIAEPDLLTDLGDALLFVNTPGPAVIGGYSDTLFRANLDGAERIHSAGFTIEHPTSYRNLCSLATHKDIAFFAGDDNAVTLTDRTGTEPWRSDGTAAGTFLLRDIAPGIDSSQPSAFFDLGEVMVFFATSPTAGRELWRSDGTSDGTLLVADTVPGPDSDEKWPLAHLDDKLLFTVSAPDRETLWVSDGTTGGTRLLADIGSAENWISSFDLCTGAPAAITEDRAYFVNGSTLWVSDGTAGGTRVLGTLAWNPERTYVVEAVTVADVDYVLLYEGPSRRLENHIVAAIDGTAADARWLNFLGEAWLAERNGMLLSAGHIDGEAGIWSSDGTQAGTSRLAALPHGLEFEPANRQFLAVYDDLIAFSLWEPAVLARRLWRTDGTSTGTFPLGDLNLNVDLDPYSIPYEPIYPTEMVRTADGGLLYLGDSPFYGNELYRTDPAVTSSVLAVDTNLGVTRDSTPHSFTTMGAHVYFLANAADGAIGLWRTDHDGNRLERVADVANAGQAGDMSEMQDRLFFYVETADHVANTLWVSDGTATGTQPLLELPGRHFPDTEGDTEIYRNPNYAVTPAGYLFRGPDCEIWRTDGTPTGTTSLETGQCAGSFVWSHDRLYFSNFAGVWASDGRTAYVEFIAPRPENYSQLAPVFAAHRVLYLQGAEGNGEEATPVLRVWSADQTETRILGPLRPREMMIQGDSVLLAVDTGLWRTDGTPVGTELVAEIGKPQNLRLLDGRVYFLAFVGYDELYGLWTTDGTAAGTRAVLEFNDLPWRPINYAQPFPELRMEVLADTLFLWAWQRTDQVISALETLDTCDLWRIDPTAAILTPVQTISSVKNEAGAPWLEIYPCGWDLLPGRFLAMPDLAQMNERLFFAQTDVSHGREPWVLGTDDRPAAAYTVHAAVTGNGAVQVEPVQSTYAPGSEVIFSATPATDWRFVGWTGDLMGDQSSVTVTLTHGYAVTALFEEARYDLTISVDGQGNVTRSAEGPYLPGTEVTLTAAPGEGWIFSGWVGDVSGTENPLTVTVTEAMEVTAVFEEASATVPDDTIYLPVIVKE